MPSDFERIFEAVDALFGNKNPKDRGSREDVWSRVTTTFTDAKRPAATPLGPIKSKTIDDEKYLLASDVLKNLIEEGQGSCRTAKQISKFLHG